MVPAALLPAIALVAGAAAGISLLDPWRIALSPLPWLAALACVAFWRRSDRLTTILIVIAFGCAGAALGGHARDAALATPLRSQLDREFGGFRIDTTDVPGEHGPVPTRLLLAEDASPADSFTTLRAEVLAIRPHDVWLASGGGVVLSVSGLVTPQHAALWRRGRTIEAPVAFRRPARYLDEGVADFERQAALDGVTLLGSIKSGLLIDVVQRGSFLMERAADLRAYVRRSVTRRVAPHSLLSAAIVEAVLIGDRGGLPDEVRTRLQAAGTYHVIAISGGNIAILAGVILVLLAIAGTSGRGAAFVTLILLVGYAEVVTAGPSVWRATLVAAAYLVARLLDHRSAPWQAMAVAGGLLACAEPLDVRNAGFLLTFGATAALLEVARRFSVRQAAEKPGRSGFLSAFARACVGWLSTSIAASAAVEIALLPVMAVTFSRITVAGLLLNLAAVPLMAVVQVAGMAIVCVDRFDALARLAGWIAHLGAAGIVESARLVDIAPWLTRRVPAPSAGVVIAYYAGLASVLVLTTRVTKRTNSFVVLTVSWLVVLAAATAIVTGADPVAWVAGAGAPDRLRLTMLDVGQGDGMILEIPDRAERPFPVRRSSTSEDGMGRPIIGRHTLMVDTGGSPFGSGGFDIGARVVEPALWAIGIRSLETMLLTHGDPDHIGGAATLIDDFHPGALWQGVPVPRAPGLQAVLARAAAAGVRVEERHTGELFTLGAVRILVLHPPPPDWERPKVRNDDSVVLEVLYGDVALLLTGDVGSDVERAIAPNLVPAKTRILKVAHHGSRTSTSQELLDAWRPQIALISCGRGNPFGHPAPDVVARLTAIGAQVFRTDRDGEITLDTDGVHVFVTTFTGGTR